MLLRGFITVFLASLFAIVISLSLNYSSPWPFERWAWSILFFGILCLILNLVYSFQAKSGNFTQILMFSLALKLLLAFIAVFIYSVLSWSDFFSFSVHFLLHYFIFTVLEINYLVYLIRRS